MAFISDNVLDAAASYISANGDRVDICSQEPATYTEATSTYTLGNETTVSYTGPANGDVSGRKITLDAITDGDVTGTGTATHWAISKTTATTDLVVAQSLTSSQGVTSGNTFTLTAADIEFPDPA